MCFVFFINVLSVLLAFMAKDRRFEFCFLAAFVLLTVFYGVRYDFGNDYWGYYDSFKESKILDFSQAKEPGWHLLLHLCQPIGYFGFVFLLTMVGNILVYKLIKHNVDRQMWWLAMYVFLFTFNFFLLGLSMMRQYMAMLICMTAVDKFMSKRQVLQYIVLICVSSTIHFSSLIMLFCVIFMFFRPNARNYLIVLSLMALVLVMTISTNSLSETVDMALQLAVLENYSGYYGWEPGSKSTIKIFFDLLFLLCTMRTYPKDRKMQIFYWVFLISFILLPFSYAMVIILRLMLYFSIFSVICYPALFKEYKKRWFSLPLLILYLLYTFYLTVGSYTGETYGNYYMVYKSIFAAPCWL